MRAVGWLVLFAFQPAYAHDWYHQLKQPGTEMSCCSDRDCRVTIAEFRNDGWWAKVDGAWLWVPPTKVLHISPPDGRSHVCANSAGIICFIPAEPRI